MKRKHKQYLRPKRPFDKARIVEEEKIKKEFGLKNKREIWKSESKIKSIREKAKKLISTSSEEQQKLFDGLRKFGFNVNSIADILSLDKRDYLKRRLQTIIIAKNIATTPKSARQLITHKKIFVGEKLVDSPSYIVPLEFENRITVRKKEKKDPEKKTKKEEVAETEEAPEEVNVGEEKNGE